MSTCPYNTIKVAIKSGIKGILNLTKAPKFDVVRPIIKANNTVNNKLYKSIGCSPITFRMMPGFKVRSTINVMIRMNRFSSPDKTITIFLLYQINGLNSPALTAGKNLEAIPFNDASNSPISKLFPL